MIGETIREFEIVSELGAGGYGAVYRAHDTSVNRDVAMKVILPQHAEKDDFKQRFEAEAQLVAQLESRQIVPLYSYWQDERGAFLVMRLIRGGSLRRILSKQGALSLSQTIRIMSDIAEALSVAHENDVVHRDLKPENILIDERGNAYLTDFGIAKRTTDTENVTDADAVVGTWAYLSPEQIQSADITPQTDIYASGIMLYELLSGKHPFQETPVAMMIMKHLQEALPNLSEERPDLPGDLDDIIAKATAKDPEDRYTSTGELIADLKLAANESAPRPAPIQIVQRRKHTSPEERNRQSMLQNVRKFWIEGVLENSVQDAVLLNLGKSDASSQINNPWETVIRSTNADDRMMPPDASILDIFERMNGKLLILGEPGGGKTTMMLELTRELIRQAEVDDAHLIPVVFNLSSWADKQLPLKEWIAAELSSKYQVPAKVAATWIENDELLLLLDGLDEVQADVRDACVEAINAYRTEHGFVDIVVCSRIHDYDNLANKLLLNGAIVIQPLTDEQIQGYLQQFGASATLAAQLIESDPELAELSRSPLMLNIIVQAYQDVSTETLPEAATVEERRQQVFELYVENTLKRHKSPEYAPEQTHHFLKNIANAMQHKGMTIFQIENIEQDWFLNKQEAQRADTFVGLTLIATLTMPQLLAALMIGSVINISPLWLFIAFIVNWVIEFVGLAIEQYRPINHTVIAAGAGLVTTLLIVLPLFSSLASTEAILLAVATMLYGSMNYLSLQKIGRNLFPFESRPTKYRVSRKDMDWQTAIVAALKISAIIALLVIRTTITVPTINIIAGISIGFIAIGCMYYILSGLRPAQDDSFYTYPQLQRAWAMNAFKVSVPVIMITVLTICVAGLIVDVALASILLFAVGVSLLIGSNLWVYTGGINVIIMGVALPFIARRGYIPPDVFGFLDYVRRAILMRRVGKGYIFIHRYLLEYFADEEAQESYLVVRDN